MHPVLVVLLSLSSELWRHLADSSHTLHGFLYVCFEEAMHDIECSDQSD